MDDAQFDDLTKALARGLPRRQMLKLLGSGLLALAGFGSGGRGSAAAGALERHNRRGTGSPPGQPSTCPAGKSACGDYCCHPGQECCGDVCTDIRSDPSHCGACDTACAAGLYCVDGACSVCPKGHHVLCNGACCPPNGTCETRGHGRGVACGDGQCCAVGETCCASRDERGRPSGVCCSASQTCVTTDGPAGSSTGFCQDLVPLATS
ncbi:MAG TPA: hypothetical protein VEZ12_22295 [Herpetosiphonaceae bacterium]|nr:hypothetical protein [Herpetosiphonaceae bacterium]